MGTRNKGNAYTVVVRNLLQEITFRHSAFSQNQNHQIL